MQPDTKYFNNIKHLCIGHCCHDWVGEAYILGGSASYSGFLSKAWSLDTSVLTSVGNDFLFFDRFENLGINLLNVPAEHTTVFHNKYMENYRIQYLKSRADTINSDHLAERRTDYDIVQFCPIADEIAPDIIELFPNSLKVASIQGFLRQWDNKGLVALKEMNWSLLKNVDIVFLSTEDIQEAPHYLKFIIAQCTHVIVTDNENGATAYYKNEAYHYPSIQTNSVDATGAGDTFATAYAIDYYLNKDITRACSFAHSAASLIIEHVGLSDIPQLSDIRSRQREYLSNIEVPIPVKASF